MDNSFIGPDDLGGTKLYSFALESNQEEKAPLVTVIAVYLFSLLTYSLSFVHPDSLLFPSYRQL